MPATPAIAIPAAFHRGAYKDVVAATVDAPEGAFDLRHVEYAVGALQFVGRVDDAQTLFQLHQETMTLEARVAARFFLGIGFTRISRYDEARAFFGTNLAAVRHGGTPSARARFYTHQGLAFYRYFHGRFGKALDSARQAWDAAFASSYRFGQVLAADLRGHALVQIGDVAAGLHSLDEAARFAEMLGNGGVAHALVVSRAGYRAAHGRGGDGDELEEFLRTLPAEDSYSINMLCLELARQHTLRGRVRRSEAYLERAGSSIYASGHRRLKASLHHRLAYNRLLMGRFAAAAAMADKGLAELEPRVDLTLTLELLGLKAHAMAAAGEPADAALLREIAALTVRTGSGKAGSILARRTGAAARRSAPGDDPLGEVKDLTCKGRAASTADVTALIASGYLSFLYEVMPVPLGGKALYFDLVPGTLLVFDEGDVMLEREGGARTLKLFAKALGRGVTGKRELIEQIWGYDYHALRHDSLLYQTVARLRRLLGDRGDWLVTSPEGYALAADVRVFVHEHPGRAAALPLAPELGSPRTSTAPPDARRLDAALNHRQLLILAELAKLPFLNVADCMRLFTVSRVTALRDLAGLVEAGRLVRRGRGRATSYSTS